MSVFGGLLTMLQTSDVPFRSVPSFPSRGGMGRRLRERGAVRGAAAGRGLVRRGRGHYVSAANLGAKSRRGDRVPVCAGLPLPARPLLEELR